MDMMDGIDSPGQVQAIFVTKGFEKVQGVSHVD